VGVVSGSGSGSGALLVLLLMMVPLGLGALSKIFFPLEADEADGVVSIASGSALIPLEDVVSEGLSGTVFFVCFSSSPPVVPFSLGGDSEDDLAASGDGSVGDNEDMSFPIFPVGFLSPDVVESLSFSLTVSSFVVVLMTSSSFLTVSLTVSSLSSVEDGFLSLSLSDVNMARVVTGSMTSTTGGVFFFLGGKTLTCMPCLSR